MSVGAPKLDGITLKSASEVEIEFTEEINTTNLKASNIEISGYELQKNGKFAETKLTGDSQLNFSTSGKKLIVKAANKDVLFNTSLETLNFKIDEDTFSNKSSKIENDEIKFSQSELNGLSETDIVDRAKPVMVGAKLENNNSIKVTYTEAVEFKGSDNEKTASQFTVDKASKSAYGISVSGDATNELKISFNENDVFKSDLDVTKTQVKYKKNINVLVKDKKGNEADDQTLVGIDRNNVSGGDNTPTPEVTGNPNVTAKVTNEDKGADAAVAVAAEYTFNVTKEAKEGDKVTIENVADANVVVTLNGTENLTGVAQKIVTAIKEAEGSKYDASNSGAEITLKAKAASAIDNAPTATVEKATEGTLEVSSVKEKVKGADEVTAKVAEFKVEITKGAEKKGTIVVAAPGADKVEVEVEEGDTPSQVATKFKQHLLTMLNMR